MSSLKETKARIALVGSTLKITSAMKMVASAKLHKAQQAIEGMLPYEKSLHRILEDLLAAMESRRSSQSGSSKELGRSTESGAAVDSQPSMSFRPKRRQEGLEAYSLMEKREVGAVAVVAFSSNSSLCGAFNSSVAARVREVVLEHLAAGLDHSSVTVFSVGRKMTEALTRLAATLSEARTSTPSTLSDDILTETGASATSSASVAAESSVGAAVVGASTGASTSSSVDASVAGSSTGQPSCKPPFEIVDCSNLSGTSSYEGCASLAQTLLDGFLSGRYDKVELVFNHFKSVASQPTTRQTFLPISLDSVVSGPRSSKIPLTSKEEMPRPDNPEDFILEPGPEALVNELLPKVVKLQMYTTLLDSNAAEHAARTLAMQNATDNGTDLLDALTLDYNKARQQKITSEILDLVSGTMV